VATLLTDPPYSSGGLYRADRAAGSVAKYIGNESQKNLKYPEFYGDNRDQRSLLAWMTLWLAECHRILEPGGVAMVFTDWRQLPIATDAYQAAGLVWRGIIAWDKTSASRTSAPGYPRHQCEFVLWGSKGPLLQRPPATGLTIDGCLRYPVVRDKAHPTEKPIALLTDLLKIGRPGGVVLDPFAGSGTTGAAALRSGCPFLGCEMSSDYHAIASDRLRAEDTWTKAGSSDAGQLALLPDPSPHAGKVAP
jgi:site-specific DNA-methyltransferase (adenine-specific)